MLVRLLAVGFCLLLTAQLLILQPQARNYLSYVHRAEGEEIPTSPALTGAEMYISITLLAHGPAENVKVLINGKPVGDFRENPVFVPVCFGDTVAIDATQASEELRFHLGSLPIDVDTSSLTTSGVCRASVFQLGRVVRRETTP